MSGSRDTLIDTDEVLERLRGMDPIDFEHFCADLWRRQGWNADVRQASRDAGVDVVLRRKEGGLEQQAVLQAKRYADGNKVTSEDVQQYNSLKEQEEADFAAVVTTSSFTKDATEMAEDLSVRLIDGNDLVRVIDEADAFDLVNEYAPVEQEEASDFGSADTQFDQADDPTERLAELRSILENPSDVSERRDKVAWKYVWNPPDRKWEKRFAGGLIGIPIVILLTTSLGAGIVFASAALAALFVAGSSHHLNSRGHNLVEQYHDEIYEHAREQIKNRAQEKMGATGPNVSTYVFERTEKGEQKVQKPRRYHFMTLVLVDSSMGAVENAWIDVPKVKYHSGELTQEFFYDQVTRLNREDGNLKLYLSDGSEHAWETKSIPDRALQDIRDRIRAYK
jgi:hypothetical protein